jgi:hypothetical protein
VPLDKKVTLVYDLDTMKHFLLSLILVASVIIGHQAHASTNLIKGASFSSIYYVANDGKRYVFPNDKTYFSWYSDFSGVTNVSDEELASYAIGGNVTYRPGFKLVKVQTDPKTYTVDRNGTLRWVSSETIASELYGTDWALQTDDIPDIFFTNYKLGTSINAASDFSPSDILNAATSISEDKEPVGGAVEPVVPPETPVVPPESLIGTQPPATVPSDAGAGDQAPSVAYYENFMPPKVCDYNLCAEPFLVSISSINPWDPYSISCSSTDPETKETTQFEVSRTYGYGRDIATGGLYSLGPGFQLPSVWGVSYQCQVNFKSDNDGSLEISRDFTVTVPSMPSSQ